MECVEGSSEGDDDSVVAETESDCDLERRRADPGRGGARGTLSAGEQRVGSEGEQKNHPATEPGESAPSRLLIAWHGSGHGSPTTAAPPGVGTGGSGEPEILVAAPTSWTRTTMPGPPGPPTRSAEAIERWEEASLRARARGGRLEAAERAAVTVASYGLFKSLRRQRRRLTETIDRFRLVEKTLPPDRGDSEEARKLILFHGVEDLLREPTLPSAPPPAEEEARGPGGSQSPQLLRRAGEWWHKERERQTASPFEAGKVSTVRLRWRDGLRPVPRAGRYLSWGPSVSTETMAPEERVVFLRLLAKDVRSGALRMVSWDMVDVVTPAFVAKHPVTGKPRLVHDLRAINVRLQDSTVKLDRALDALGNGSLAAKLDLAQAFRHVGVEKVDRRVLVFVVDGVPLQWQALPFGAAQSPELFAKALEPIIASLGRSGRATYIVYVDDILIVADDVEALDAAVVSLCESLAKGGWTIALDKCFPYAMEEVPFLGLIVDLGKDVLRVSVAKAKRLEDLCEKVLDGRSSVSLRDLQRIGGLLAFFATAAPEAGLMRLGINAATAEAERLPGRTVGVKGKLSDDLRFWRANAKHLPNMTRPPPGRGQRYAAATDAAGLPRLGFGGVVWEGAAPAPDLEKALGEAATFADVECKGVEAFGGKVFKGPIPVAMASASSAALEVYAFHRVLKGLAGVVGKEALKGAVIAWYCDAQVAVGAVGKWRAKAEGLLHEVNMLLDTVRSLGCSVVPHWVSRAAGWQPVADFLSKSRWVRDRAEWAMPQEVATKLMTEASFEPRVDLFATAASAKLPSYVSQFPELGNTWTDAFARGWDDVDAFAFPPFSVVPAMMRHICRAQRCRVLAVVPRATVVPTRLHVRRRWELPPTPLIDAEGNTALMPCPVALDVLEVHAPVPAPGGARAGAG